MRTSRWLRLSLLLTVLLSGAAQAFWFGLPMGVYIPQTGVKYGAVYARTIVPGPNGKPVYVVYDTAGKEITEIGETHAEPYASARVMAGDYYRALLAQWKMVRERYELTEKEMMTREAYEAATFTTVDNKSISQPDLRSDTLFVAVRPADELYTTDPAQLVLLQLAVDPSKTLADDTSSVLLGKDGKILHQTPENIGFRVGYYGTPDNPVSTKSRGYDDTIYGPIQNAYVNLGLAYVGAAITDEKGKYSMLYVLPPCPGFTFEYTTNAYLELYFKRFNPRGSPVRPYVLMNPGWDFCNGLSVYTLETLAIVASSAVSMAKSDFRVNLMVLAGKSYVAGADGNALPIGGQTTFDGERPALERAKQDEYDLDGDGKPDTTALGRIVTPEPPPEGEPPPPYFEKMTPEQNPPLQGVWLSSAHDKATVEAGLAGGQSTTLPDFTHLPDWSADFNDRALLGGLSAEDLRDTDLYVFRESDGSLLIERRGLEERETSMVGADAETGRFYYTLRLLSRPDAFLYARNNAEYAQFQKAEGLIDPAQYEREADHLRAGELVRIIAINRPSGYLGSLTLPLEAAGSGGSGEISFHIDELVMRPPNLRIWAERQSKVKKGLTRDETRDQAIGHEGAGLADDVMISLYTEWLDADGRLLPEELTDYGYTGRIAKVVSTNQLAPMSGNFSECEPDCDGNQLSQFSIRPGRQLQVVRLSEQVLGKEHLYVQVSGTPSNRNPDFGSSGQEGMLQFRPKKFVPVKVPVYDEKTSHLATQVYNRLRSEDPNRDLTRPEPYYRFVYRPEFQFSLYELTVDEIRRTDVAGETSDVLSLSQPVITSSDQFVEIFYDLFGPASGSQQLSPLEPYSYQGERELVFALGEQELRATLGADGTLRFDNLDQLANLNPEDYLTLRLYSNNDPANVLWEWAFEYLAVDSLRDISDLYDDDGVIHLSADDTVVPLQAVLYGYASRDPETKTEKRMFWRVEGDGTAQPSVQVDADMGIFNTTLTMPTTVGARATVSGVLDSGGEVTEAVFGTLVIEPGKPASISLTTEGEVSVLGVSKMTVSATIRDQHGNLVADGTPVQFSVSGGAVQEGTTPITQSGHASTVLAGGEIASNDNTLTVRAGDIAVQLPFIISPLQVTLGTFSTQPRIGTEMSVEVRVTDVSDNPAVGASVKLGTSYGIIREDSLVTDGSGRVTAHILNPPNPGQAVLSARVGFSSFAEQAYEVTLPPGHVQSLNTRHALVVGDQSTSGVLVHERYDGTQIAMDFPVQTSIPVAGAVGQTLSVKLGDLAAPNLAPVAAYFMTDLEYGVIATNEDSANVGGFAVTGPALGFLAPDATGLHPAVAESIEVVPDHPMGRGRSYRFQNSRLSVEDLSVLAKPTGIGFRVDVKPDSTGTVVFDYHGGSQRLSYDTSGRFRYQINTVDGAVEVVSDVVSVGTWHTVAGRYLNGALELEVDGILHTTSATADMAYLGSATLEIADYSGHLSGLQFYDWGNAPLLALGDGGSTQNVNLSETGTGTVTIRSLGHLNDQQAGSKLPLLRVAVIAGGMRQYVSLLSSELYTEIGGFYADTLHPNPPPINVAGLNSGYRSNGSSAFLLGVVVSPAYAWDVSLSDVGSWVAEAVNFFIPYQDIAMLYEQLKYLATNDPNFDEDKLVTSLIGTLSIIPVAKGLKLAKPLVKFALFARRINPKFLGKFISVLDSTLEKAWNSRSVDVIVDLLPFMLIAGELAMDPEAVDGLELMIKSIESDDDLWTWIEYLRLPTDGWTGGETDMPELQLVTNEHGTEWQDVMFAQGSNLLDIVIPKAHAVSPGKGVRVSAQQIKIILKTVRRLGNDVTNQRLDNMIDGIKGLVAGMKQTQWAPVRAITHSKQAFISAMAMGSAAARKVLRDAKTLRLSPMTIMAIIGYLESRRECGDTPGCKPHLPEVNRRLTGLYGSFITSAVLRDDGSVKGNNENGALFHIAMLAFKHFEYELGSEDSRVVAIEATIPVQLYNEFLPGKYRAEGGTHARKVDIVLAGEAGNTAVNEKNVWLEVKSYKTPFSSSSFGLWTGAADKRNRNHREFFLDRVASTTNNLTNPVAKPVVKDVQWRFHDFYNKQTGERGANNTDIENARKWQVKLPRLSGGTAHVSLGYRTAAANDNAITLAPIKNRIKIENIKTWVLGTARQALLDGVSDDIILKVIESVE